MDTKALIPTIKNLFTYENRVRFVKGLIPFLIILIISFFPFSIYFKGEGINGGQDVTWHLVYIYDYVYGLEHGFSGIGPNHLLLGNLGYNTYLFYAPYGHIAVAVLYECFKGAGASIVGCMKFMAIFTTFLSGICTYLLALKMTKGDKLISLLAAIVYIFNPYRLYNFFYRFAYNEALAQGFIPLFFLGIYSIMNNKRYKVSAYVCTIIGSVMLIGTHPFTAVSCATAAVFLIVVNFRGLKRIFTSVLDIISLVVSVLLILGLIGVYLFPMLSSRSTNYYVLSDEVRMWTNIDHLMVKTNISNTFAGFLDFGWIGDSYSGKKWGESATSWALDLSFFLFFGVLAIFLYAYFLKKNKKHIGIILAIISAASIIIFCRREEVILSVIALLLVLGCFFFFQPKYDNVNFSREEVKPLLKNPEIYALIVLFILIFLVLFIPGVWYIMPSIYRQAQFPFRFWSVFWIVAIMLVLLLTKPFHKSIWFKGSLVVFSCFLLSFSQGPADKRIAYYNGAHLYVDSELYSLTVNRTGVGSQNEYMPKIFNDWSYKSEYSNSLYPAIRSQIKNRYKPDFGMSKYKTPVFLEGEGSIKITSLNTPNVIFQVTITSEKALIQLPQFYYDGYVANYTSDSYQNFTSKGKYIDGLVSFDAKQGSYKMNVTYQGSNSYKLFRPIFFISVTALPILAGLGAFFAYKKRKNEEISSLKEQHNSI